jgi:hypothetical protein
MVEVVSKGNGEAVQFQGVGYESGVVGRVRELRDVLIGAVADERALWPLGDELLQVCKALAEGRRIDGTVAGERCQLRAMSR